VRRDVGVASLGEVAVLGATNEAGVARRVEPATRFSGGDDLNRLLWLALLLVATTTAATASSTAVAALTTPASAAMSPSVPPVMEIAITPITPITPIATITAIIALAILVLILVVGAIIRLTAGASAVVGGGRRAGLAGGGGRWGRLLDGGRAFRAVRPFLTGGLGCFGVAAAGVAAGHVSLVAIGVVARIRRGGFVGRTSTTASARWASTFAHAVV
jgi:hypothetical protein